MGESQRSAATAAVILAAAGALAAGVVGFAADPRLGALLLGAPLALAIVLSPPVGTAVLLFALPLDELSGVVGSGLPNKVLGVAVVGGWLLHALLHREAVAIPGIGLPLFALVLWGAASALWAVDSSATLSLLVTYVQLLGLYLLVANVLCTPGVLRRALDAHVAGGTVLALFGLWLTSEGVLQGGRTAIVVDRQLLVEPNAFAAALLLPIAIALTGTIDRERGVLERLALAVAGTLCLTALVLTMSRGAAVAVVVMALVVSVARGKLMLPLVAALLAVPGLLLAPPEFWQRWSEGATLADRGAGRLDIWRVGWVVIRQNPLLGVGLGCFPIVYYGFLSQAAGISWKHAEAVAQVLIKYPHSIYLGMAAELGIVGFGLLVAGLALHLRAALATWRALRAGGHPAAGPALAVVAAVVALLVQGFAFDIAHRKYLWVTLGMAALGSMRARAAAAEAPLRRAA